MLKILHKLGRTDGTEIVEAAVVLPLVFMFLLGIVWFGRAFNIYSTMSQAVQRGAIAAARPTCATCTQPTDNWSGTSFPGDTTVDNAVYAVTDLSNFDRNLFTANPPATPPASCSVAEPAVCNSSVSRITMCRSVALNGPATPAQCGVLVSFKYPFQLYLPFTSLNLQRIDLTATAQSRMEN